MSDPPKRMSQVLPRQGRDYLKTDDIAGDKVSTKRYTTMHAANRQLTNPLDPVYNYPGFKQIQAQIEQNHNRNQSSAGSQNGSDSVFKLASLQQIHPQG